jgi:hypothetical protein
MKVKIEIELNSEYSNIHFSEDKMRDILFEYADRIKNEINEHTGSLYFNGMALATVNCKSSKIIEYKTK